ncbi:hypothetical protein M5E88_13965 [Akkermansia muciniphila]|nr:hypothetical protein M5E88_13965 [Akkermansia muciniphila]
MVDGMVQEARLDAMGKGTWSRLIIVSTPDDEARNMRTLGVMSKNTRTGKWHLVNRLQTLPAGFYVSPAYSTLLEGSKKARARNPRPAILPAVTGRIPSTFPATE